jgi:hypothetical protein
MPSAFWPLGVHFCRSGSPLNETETRSELAHLLENVVTLPFDSHCIDSEMTALIVSRDDGKADEFVKQLKDANKKLFLHLSLSAVDAETEDAEEILKLALTNEDDDESIFTGMFGKTRRIVYPDYITKSQQIADWLRKQKNRLNNTIFPISDGFFLYRNYPFDDSISSKSLQYIDESFDFVPRARRTFESAIEHLIPLNAHLRSGEPLIRQLNNYGRQVIEVFQQTLNDDGKFCIADSFRESSEGNSCGMLMRVERASWTSFQATIRKSVFYSLIGMSFYGAEVCGSGEVNGVAEDLCIRWYQFAVFVPLFYVNAHRVPTKFTKYAERIMVHAVRTRYSLLGYMWTCMFADQPLLRPFRIAYGDNEAIDSITDHQLMFGEALMIAPITEPLVVELTLHFPEKYFELWSGIEMPQHSTHFSIVMHDIPIFLRAGHIVALSLAHDAVSAEAARLEPYLLVVGLSCTESYSCHASGRQWVVGGVEFKFEASETHLNITVIASGGRDALCGPERFASGDFRFAKIYGLGEFKEQYRSNDYLSLDLNICDADWNEIFSISI